MVRDVRPSEQSGLRIENKVFNEAGWVCGEMCREGAKDSSCSPDLMLQEQQCECDCIVTGANFMCFNLGQSTWRIKYFVETVVQKLP